MSIKKGSARVAEGLKKARKNLYRKEKTAK